MIAAHDFMKQVHRYSELSPGDNQRNIQCTLKDSLTYTGVGHTWLTWSLARYRCQ